MSQVSRPTKQGGTTSYVAEDALGIRGSAGDMDTDLNLLYSAINALDATNLTAGTVTTALLADGSITQALLGFVALVAFSQLQVLDVPATSASAAELLLAESAWTAKGGTVLLVAVVWGTVTANTAGTPLVRLNLRRDGTAGVPTDGTVIALAQGRLTVINSLERVFAMPLVWLDDIAAGAIRYKLTFQFEQAVSHARGYNFLVVEFA